MTDSLTFKDSMKCFKDEMHSYLINFMNGKTELQNSNDLRISRGKLRRIKKREGCSLESLLEVCFNTNKDIIVLIKPKEFEENECCFMIDIGDE